MRYNTLGKTGLFVSEICLGTMTFSGKGFYETIGTVDQPTANSMIRRAVDCGINFIDTADSYSTGAAEEMLGAGIKSLGINRKDLVISTKGYTPMSEGQNDRGATRGHLTDAVEASLRRLGMDYIDIYHIHAFDPVTPLEQSIRALDDLVRRGLIRYIACSNWSAWQIMKAVGCAERFGWTRLEAVQAYYSIATRDIEREIVPLLNDQDIGLLVWSPLAGGLLAGKLGSEFDQSRRASFDFPPVDRRRLEPIFKVMNEIAGARPASLAQIAIAWLLSKKAVTSVIIGAKHLDQLNDNIAAADVRLSVEEIQRLDEVSLPQIEYPAWQQIRQGALRVPPPFSPPGSD